MAVQVLNLEITNLERVRQFTQDMAERAADLTPVWETAHEAFLIEMQHQFATEGAHLTGQEWQPLSEAYAEWKQVHYAGQPILQRTSDLIQSLVNADDANHIAVMTPERAAFGTKVPYAIHHQNGTPGHWSEYRKKYVGALPQRRIIVQRDAYKRLVFRAAIAWILRGGQHAEAA